jgi:hypothetical protein
MEILIQGLLITTNRNYVKLSYGSQTEIKDSIVDDCFYITFRRGFRGENIIHDQITLIENCILHDTPFIKVANPIYELNGLKFTKVSPFDYVFSQYLIDDIEEMVMYYDEYQCQMLIPSTKDYDLCKYVELLEKNPYLRIIDKCNLTCIKSFYLINLTNKPIKLTSGNEFRFKTKSFYEQYLLESVDVELSFIELVTNKLKEYGIECQRLPIDKNTESEHRVLWKITDKTKQLSYRTGYSPMDYVVQQSFHVDFTLTTPSLELLDDFRTRYQNIGVLSQLTTFQTKDKLGKEWSSNVKWSPISTDFNQEYDQDQAGNLANSATFSADVYHMTVYDERYYEINDIILDLLYEDCNLKIIK